MRFFGSLCFLCFYLIVTVEFADILIALHFWVKTLYRQKAKPTKAAVPKMQKSKGASGKR